MAMKKHIVRVSYHTYVDVVVYADESVSYEDVLELGRQKAANDSKTAINEILYNMKEDGNTEVATFRADVFKDKNEAYYALLNKTERYYLISKKIRPTFTIEDDYVEGATKDIKVKSIVVFSDDCSPLRVIDENDVMYDVDDYLDKDNITKLYAIVMGWI